MKWPNQKYEQRLIREQIAQLTGRRFLTGYANDETQYQALMNAGITFAQTYQLIPGVALTNAQIAQGIIGDRPRFSNAEFQVKNK